MNHELPTTICDDELVDCLATIDELADKLATIEDGSVAVDAGVYNSIKDTLRVSRFNLSELITTSQLDVEEQLKCLREYGFEVRVDQLADYDHIVTDFAPGARVLFSPYGSLDSQEGTVTSRPEITLIPSPNDGEIYPIATIGIATRSDQAGRITTIDEPESFAVRWDSSGEKYVLAGIKLLEPADQAEPAL